MGADKDGRMGRGCSSSEPLVGAGVWGEPGRRVGRQLPLPLGLKCAFMGGALKGRYLLLWNFMQCHQWRIRQAGPAGMGSSSWQLS